MQYSNVYINRQRALGKIGSFALFSLYPAAHFYAYFSAESALPILPSGFLASASLFFSIFLIGGIVHASAWPRGRFSTAIFFIAFLLAVSLGLISASYALLSTRFFNNLDLSQFYLRAVLDFIPFFIIGYCFAYSSFFSKWIPILALVMGLMVIAQVDPPLFQLPKGDRSSVYYLMLSNACAVFFLLGFSYIKSSWVQILIGFVMVFALYALHSRAALFFFVTSIVFFWAISPISIPKKFGVVFILLLTVLPLLYGFDVISIFEKSRHYRLIFEEDSSLDARYIFLSQGIDRIFQSPLLGDLGGQLEYGEKGEYIHNVLALWSQFGLLAFLLYVYLFFYSIIILWKYRYEGWRGKFGLLLGVYCGLQIFFARSFNYETPWILFGFAAGLSSSIIANGVVGAQSE